MHALCDGMMPQPNAGLPPAGPARCFLLTLKPACMRDCCRGGAPAAKKRRTEARWAPPPLLHRLNTTFVCCMQVPRDAGGSWSRACNVEPDMTLSHSVAQIAEACCCCMVQVTD